MALREMYKKCKKLDPKLWIGLYVIFSTGLLYCYPPFQVSHFGINNATVNATLENQYRATLAQILGGGAVLVGIYFAWNNLEVAQATLKSDQETSQKKLEVALATLDSNMKTDQGNLKVSQEGQITERFTRAVDQLGAIDQLGNPAIEIRLGGIYALERIANESEKDHWPIMEILTAYVRKNSPIEMAEIQEKVSLDIQAILTVIGRRNYTYKQRETKRLDLSKTNLKGVELTGAHLEKANLSDAYLEKANLSEAHFEKANLTGIHLEGALLGVTHLEETYLIGAYFEGAKFVFARLKGADLRVADLRGAFGLSPGELSKVKTLYKAELDDELRLLLEKEYPDLFNEPDLGTFLKSE